MAAYTFSTMERAVILAPVACAGDGVHVDENRLRVGREYRRECACQEHGPEDVDLHVGADVCFDNVDQARAAGVDAGVVDQDGGVLRG